MNSHIRIIVTTLALTTMLPSIAHAITEKDIEEKAREIVAGEFQIQKIDVATYFTGRTNRVDGFSARVVPQNCTGFVDYYFDESGTLTSTDKRIKC